MGEREPFRGSAAGLTRQQLRGQRFRRVHRGVYVLTPADDTLALRADAALTLFPDAVLSHQTAARLLGLPSDDRGLVHVTRPQATAATERQGIRTHRARLLRADVVSVEGRRLTSPERTFLDLAAVLSDGDLVVLADAVTRRVGEARLARRLSKAAGVRGVRRARGALLQADPLSDSPAETKTRLILHAAGFPRLRHGLNVHNDHGSFLARPDLADEGAGVAIQYDGLVHLGDDPERRRFDIDRDESLRQHGWQVVVLTALDLRHPERMVAKVAAAYARAASVGARPT